MENFVKKVKMAAALLAACGQMASAGGFNLDSAGADFVRGGNFRAVSLPKAAPAAADDVISAQLNLRVPFGAVQKAVLEAAESQKELAVINKGVPVISKYGDNLRIKNIRLDLGGIIVEPEIMFRPYGEAKNVLAVKIQKIKIHVSMSPSKSFSGAEQMTQEDIMEKAMDAAIKGIMKALDKKLAGSGLKAEDMVKFKYDKQSWILRAFISTEFVKRYIPGGLLGDVSFNSFSFDEKAIFVGIGTD